MSILTSIMGKNMKINISQKDMTWDRQGMGFNNYNFIRNVAPRINQWLLEIYQNADIDADIITEKLKRIAAIIDE